MKIKNSFLSALAVVAFTSSYLFCDEHREVAPKKTFTLPLLDERTIEQQRIVIEKMLNERTWKKRAAIGAMVGFAAYSIFSSYYYSISDSPTPKPSISFWQRLQMWETWKNLGIDLAKSFGFSVMSNYAYKFLDGYTDQAVIAWYVSAVVPYDRTINGMYGYSDQLSQTSLDDDKALSFCYNALATDHHLLIKQVTQLFGFMMCKADGMMPNRAAHVRALVRHSMMAINRMTVDLQELIAKRYNGITRIISAIDMELQRACAHFARLEQSPWIGPNDIQSLMLTHVLR